MKLPTLDSSSKYNKIPQPEKVKRVRRLVRNVRELEQTLVKAKTKLKKTRQAGSR
jgi:hypothetical protein